MTRLEKTIKRIQELDKLSHEELIREAELCQKANPDSPYVKEVIESRLDGLCSGEEDEVIEMAREDLILHLAIWTRGEE
jgi:hypothetical protein